MGLSCQDDEDYYDGDFDLVDEEASDPPELGTCCACEGIGYVRTIIILDKRSPEPGGGCWECLKCGLPMAGAIAVLCDFCKATGDLPRFACLGFPAENRRIPIEQLTETFAHDLANHPGEV
jgi:hypothetical protein